MELNFIGHVRSPFQSHAGTPIQPSFAHGSRGEIVLESQYVEALADLDGFDRIWVIFALHQATSYKPRVVPYRDVVERGLFATRAPCRPNPIGISAVRLDCIEGNVLHVSEIDMLDGTPVIDIKPYVPEFDAFPSSKAGWFDLKRTAVEQADGRFER